MTITIIGGGNIGTLMAAQLSQKGFNVIVYTRDITKWSDNITVYNKDNNTQYSAKINKITDDLKEAVSETNLILSTVPAYAMANVIKQIEKYIKPRTILGFIPGYGGMELLCNNIIEKGCIIFGTQRVCSIARLKEYGKYVVTSGKRKEMYISALPNKETEMVRDMFEKLFDIKTIGLPNYLNVTLTPTNPILHTTRMYTLFNDYYNGKTYKRIPLFYEEWDIESSNNLIECDFELHQILSNIDIDTNMIVPILKHYESWDAQSLTTKISGINSLKGILTPMIKQGGGYIPDFESRYFKSDFPYGLLIIKAFGLITKVETPYIDNILVWYQKMVNKEYLDNTNNLGKDSKEISLPQNNGINSLSKIKKFYNK